MNILIFKTDVDTEIKYNCVNYLLRNHGLIIRWSIDREDIDRVLRIEAFRELHESTIISLLKKANIFCADLDS